ncbi:MAG: ABC transporter ATP-binding protein [archaeon]
MGRVLEAKDIDFKYNFSLYLSFLKKYKLAIFLVLLFVLISESKHILDRYLFKVIIDNGTNFMEGVLTRGAFIDILIIVAIVFVIASLVLVATNWLRLHFINILENDLINDLKRRFFKHILRLDHNFHTTHKTGSMISRLTRGASSMERMTDVIFFNFATLILQLIVVFITLLYLDILSSVIILFSVVAFLAFSFYIQRIQEKSNVIANKTEDIEKGNMADFFTNVDSIKYYGKEKTIEKRYGDLTENTKVAFLKNWHYFRWMSAGQTFIIAVSVFLLIYFPILGFMEGNISLGTLTFIYTTYVGLLGYMYGFVQGLRGFYRSMADFQELFDYNKLTNEIKDKPNAKNLKIEKGTVEFRDVDFRYGKRKIFENFNLKIKENEKVALVGHSGSGKTTLVKLLNRFYDVNDGKVLIDGKDIRDFKQESVRSETGIVPQECVLFDDTLYNNIAFANPSASKEEVMKAIKFAQLDKIVEIFPDKENTVVGERGVRLSGGEKQRVSVARAILDNRKVLVLDEATSSLDSETEHEIQKDLRNLLKGRTSIIIAHRLSTIMNADRIIVMKKGEIIQEGKHSVLIKKPGEYKKLWNLQKGGYIK